MSGVDDLRSRRVERLRGELHDSGAVALSRASIEVLKEIERARFPHRHERRFPGFGAIVSAGDDSSIVDKLEALGAIRLIGRRPNSHLVREMADGIQSFALIRDETAELVLLASPIPREVELVRLHRSLGSDATLVCRTGEGVVKVWSADRSRSSTARGG